jgi:hypothetical protein
MHTLPVGCLHEWTVGAKRGNLDASFATHECYHWHGPAVAPRMMRRRWEPANPGGPSSTHPSVPGAATGPHSLPAPAPPVAKHNRGHTTPPVVAQSAPGTGSTGRCSAATRQGIVAAVLLAAAIVGMAAGLGSASKQRNSTITETAAFTVSTLRAWVRNRHDQCHEACLRSVFGLKWACTPPVTPPPCTPPANYHLHAFPARPPPCITCSLLFQVAS